jgi:hypothetical protein
MALELSDEVKALSDKPSPEGRVALVIEIKKQ